MGKQRNHLVALSNIRCGVANREDSTWKGYIPSTWPSPWCFNAISRESRTAAEGQSQSVETPTMMIMMILHPSILPPAPPDRLSGRDVKSTKMPMPLTMMMVMITKIVMTMMMTMPTMMMTKTFCAEWLSGGGGG